MVTIKSLVMLHLIEDDTERAEDGDLKHSFEPAQDIKLSYKTPDGYFEPVESINVERDGNCMIITAQSAERVGEWEIEDFDLTLISVEVYKRVLEENFI